jgi:predicted  nucleic acid-binding Zn-ribbon protein
MSSESVYVDLSPVIHTINRVAETLNSNLAVVDGKVEVLAQEQEATKDRIEQLYQEFMAFVAADAKQKQLQLAASEIIRVRQELEKKFGYYDKVRRTTTGILQATDVAIVRQETMHSATEQLMLAAPGYWLAPALVALTAWIQDNRTLAEKAMNEAIRRDDSRTSLFFALICRRARRMEANAKWLTRYFQIQNPMSMDREVVVMLDALANGVFGGAALVACSQVVERWLTELEQQAGFLDEQRKRWAEKLDVMTPKIGANEYTTLRSNSATGQKLMQSLVAARRNQIVHDFFNQLFTGEIVVPPSLEDAVDGLLSSLVTKFDEEELPLRKEERLLQLIKDEQGDVDVAKRKAAAEGEVFEEKTNFAAMLTSSAVSPEQFGATRATQRYAVSRSRQWILAAHQDLVGRDRSEVPNEVELSCGSWKGKTVDGTNEQQLASDLTQHYASRTQQAVDAVKLTAGPWIVLIAGVLLGLLIMFQGGGAILFGLILAAAAAAFFIWKYKDLGRVRENSRQAMENERDQAARILKACMAEIADYRRELAAEDSKAQKVTEFLESLSSPQFVLQRPEQARATVA